MNETAQIEKIKKLRRNAEEFETFWDRFFEKVSDTTCDKHGAAFGGDSRFSVFDMPSFFSAHTGYYGNSSCSTFGRFDNDIAKAYMTKAINTMARQLFKKCAELMRIDAAGLTSEARKEIENLNKLIDECSSVEGAKPQEGTEA